MYRKGDCCFSDISSVKMYRLIDGGCTGHSVSVWQMIIICFVFAGKWRCCVGRSVSVSVHSCCEVLIDTRENLSVRRCCEDGASD